MKNYTVWTQCFNNDGTINSEDIIYKCETLDEAVRMAGEGEIIRYSSKYNGEDDFWEVVGDDYEEYDEEGRSK